MILPDNQKDLVARIKDIVEICHVSSSQRAAVARAQNMWIQSGRDNGQKALVNKLFAHNDRLASHLFSPSELRFILDFESYYPVEIINQGEMASRVLTREWERKDLDMTFGAGVGISLTYGSCIFKQKWGHAGVEGSLIMPWKFGVYREDINSLDEQEALCESGFMTTSDVWRQISHLPGADKLYERIISSARKEATDDVGSSYFHQVLSTNTLNTNLDSVTQRPGGIVSLTGDAMSSVSGPELDIDLIPFHELYIRNDDTEDYVTVLLIEPDILVMPWHKNGKVLKFTNHFAPKTQPYSLIQANHVPGYVWGRSELTDLMEPQGLLAQWMEDIRRLMGLQFDKLLAFSGSEGISDEKYDQFRQGGYVDLGPGGSVNDITPALPPTAFQAVEMLNKFMDDVSGFGNIMSGQGEQGVRSGNHAESAIKMASPRLRDRSLLIERQCAAAADKTLSLLEEKDGRQYSTDPTAGHTSDFLLFDLPEDRRVTVDSHSSSPIFAEDHQSAIAFGLKAGFIGGDSAIELLPLPQKDLLKQRYQKMQEQKVKMLEKAEHDPALAKIMAHGKK